MLQKNMSEITPNILAIESSTSVMRVGLSLSGSRFDFFESHDRFRHAEFIFKLISEVLSRNRVEREQLEGIIVSTGPGSFTGLRIGMAAAKGLAVALRIPVAGISIFSSNASRLFEQFGPTGMIVPSRRDEFYLGIVDAPDFDDSRITVVHTADLDAHLQGRPLFPLDFEAVNIESLTSHIISPDKFSSDMADLFRAGGKRLLETGGEDIERLEPLYIQKFPVRKVS
jgi:tRNA threonylcarbamoyl adenosine modification protein YeaZ